LSFANALQENRLVNAEYAEMLTTGKIETTHRSHYAYGFENRTINGVRCFGHSGGAIGMSANLEFCPDVGYVVVVLANLDPPAAGRISDFILLLAEKKFSFHVPGGSPLKSDHTIGHIDQHIKFLLQTGGTLRAAQAASGRAYAREDALPEPRSEDKDR
jgi:hypothetical protein